MPFLLRTNTNPGTAEWVDESSIIPTFEQFYLPTVIYREGGPVDADNVVDNTADLRALLNANPGTRKLCVFQDPTGSGITLDAGVYGDGFVEFLGESGVFLGKVTVLLEDGVELRGLKYRDIQFQTAEAITGTAPIIVDSTFTPQATFENCSLFAFHDGLLLETQNGDDIVFKDTIISRSSLDGSSSTGFLATFTENVNLEFENCRFVGATFFPADPPQFLLDSSGDPVRANVTVRGTFTFIAFTGDPLFAGNTASSFLGVIVSQEDFTPSGEALQALAAIDTAGEVDTFSIPTTGVNRGASATLDPDQDFFICSDGTAVTLMPLAEVPLGFEVTVARDSTAGAAATVNPNGADVMLPTDPVSLANPGDAVKLVKCENGAGVPHWATIL